MGVISFLKSLIYDDGFDYSKKYYSKTDTNESNSELEKKLPTNSVVEKKDTEKDTVKLTQYNPYYFKRDEPKENIKTTLDEKVIDDTYFKKDINKYYIREETQEANLVVIIYENTPNVYEEHIIEYVKSHKNNELFNLISYDEEIRITGIFEKKDINFKTNIPPLAETKTKFYDALQTAKDELYTFNSIIGHIKINKIKYNLKDIKIVVIGTGRDNASIKTHTDVSNILKDFNEKNISTAFISISDDESLIEAASIGFREIKHLNKDF